MVDISEGRPERWPEGWLGGLRDLHEAFVIDLAATLSDYLRARVEGRLRSVERLEREQFPEEGFHVFTCPPLAGELALFMSPSILDPFLRRLEGCEASILACFMDRLTRAWEALGPAPASPPAPPRSRGPALRFSFELRMGEASGSFLLSVPLRALSPFLTGEPSLAGGEVEVTALLADLSLRLADVVLLREGDILDTGKAPGGELVLLVNGEPRFAGEETNSGGKPAFRITRRI